MSNFDFFLQNILDENDDMRWTLRVKLRTEKQTYIFICIYSVSLDVIVLMYLQ